jgi:hypothetical protein
VAKVTVPLADGMADSLVTSDAIICRAEVFAHLAVGVRARCRLYQPRMSKVKEPPLTLCIRPSRTCTPSVRPEIVLSDQIPSQLLLPILLVQVLAIRLLVAVDVGEVGIGQTHGQRGQEEAVDPVFCLVDHLEGVGTQSHLVKDVYF